MSYSITPVLHDRANKQGQKKILIRVIHNRMKAYYTTACLVASNQFENGVVKNHPHASRINKMIREDYNNVERRILDALDAGGITSKEHLSSIIRGVKKNTNTVSQWVEDFVEKNPYKLSVGRLRHYTNVADDIEQFRSNTKIGDIDDDLMLKFERWLEGKGLSTNTIWGKIQVLISILNKAVDDRVLKEYPLKIYSRPGYVQGIPDYLTEDEIVSFFDLVRKIQRPSYKLAGYYFLLGCFAGFRISDLKSFNYEDRVKGDTIIIRAKKNGEIVAIPIYRELSEVLEFVKNYPCDLSEGKMRAYVKDIATLCGLGRKIKVHTARHTFGMMLTNKGFTIQEVAELLGDSEDVAKVYARVTNPQLARKIKEKFGTNLHVA